MKSLRKLLKGIVGDGVTVVVIMVILLLLLLFGGKRSTMEDFVLQMFVYVIFAGAFLIAGGIYLIVIFYRYGQAKESLLAIPGFSEARFEREAGRSPQFTRLIAISDAVCYAGADHIACVIPVSDIIWVYQPDSANVLWIYTKDRDIHKINVHVKGKAASGNSQKGLRYLMRLIARKNKNVLIGYNASYEDMYRKDFARLLSMAQGREIIDSGWLEREYIENDYYHKDFQ